MALQSSVLHTLLSGKASATCLSPAGKLQSTPFTPQRPRAVACRSSLTSVPSDQSFDKASRPSLDQEWVRLGLSYIAEDGGSKLDEEWLRLGLSFPSVGSPQLSSSTTADRSDSDLDRVWLDLGLTFSDVEPPLLDQEPEGVEAMEAPTVATDPSVYFTDDLRPIVLFDGACNFCSKWSIFLLDHDRLGNLRFASMQSEAGKVLLQRSGLKETDTSEVVLACHKRSFIGEEAILHIFERLEMPFPIIAAIGFVIPGPITHGVYKLVSKYRHKLGGPSACRLFDPRFNDRFVS